MPRSRRGSKYVQIARRLGFLRDEDVAMAEQVVEEAQTIDIATTGDLIVKAGLLDSDQAEQVEAVRRKEDLTGHRLDTLKLAHRSVDEARESTQELQSVAAMIAMKSG